MKIRINHLAFFAAITALMFSSCVSMSTMQTARTVGEGNKEVAIGGSRVTYEFESGLDTIDAKAVTGEVDVRYGIKENLDVGLKASILGTSGAYAKYQFLGDTESKFAGSVGAGVAFLSIESGSGEFKTKSKTTDISVPVYFSYHPSDWFSVYTSPRYTFRTIKNTGDERNSSHWYGATTGIRVGKRVAPFIEYSIFASNKAVEPLSQITGGISIGF